MKCLQSILAQEALPGDFEVIVLTACPMMGHGKILAQFAIKGQRGRLADNTARIVSADLNPTLTVASVEITIRMDAHTRYASDYVGHCVAMLRQNQRGQVGGPRVAHGEGLMDRAIAAAFQSPLPSDAAAATILPMRGMSTPSIFGCWPRRIFEQIGLFEGELVRKQIRQGRAAGKIWRSPPLRAVTGRVAR